MSKLVTTITKYFEFEACHRLYKDQCDFGKCQNYHGHSYKLQVHISGAVDKDGMVMNFSHLKKIVKDCIINRMDHSDLNDSFNIMVEEYRGVLHPDLMRTFVNDVDPTTFIPKHLTTCEVMSYVFACILAYELHDHTNIEKIGITLFEQSDSCCYYEIVM